MPLLQDLLDFLDATPSIRKFIRVLSLKIILTNPLDTLVARGEVDQGKGPQLNTLRSILRLTSRLQFLDVYNFRFARQFAPLDSSAATHSPTLEHLHHLRVDPLQFDLNSNLLHQLLSLVATVGTLTFNTPIRIRQMSQPTVSFSPPLPPPPAIVKRIRQLYVNNTYAIRPHSIIDPAHLESFHTRELQWEDFPWFSDFLQTVGSAVGLKHLGLPVHSNSPWPHFGLGPDQDTCLRLLDLSVFEKLETLSLSLPAWTPTPRVMNPDDPLGVYASGYDFIVRVLSIMSDTLQSITFRLTCSALPWRFERGGAHNMRTDWSQLDRALAERVPMRGLKTVRFVLSNFLDDAIAREAVKRSMPLTNAAGVLQRA
ncbi:hypothetical protein PHLGIDRAFT_256274 [Phlebiopsis gigantea 11061_1 CR5-6]|uniref:Uncharacterized protein n=1 Tax=Phlebiopsis gigantea (strain 11061_1 CR5-6) TaxID=745531 RepID=A0A0C3RS34_PHLG1|nr:hypothetical protein PHLGIDRAFT_256274 [Phlebiopsis gigantea 11061_1 CR5-6]